MMQKYIELYVMRYGNEPPRYDNNSDNRCNFFFFCLRCVRACKEETDTLDSTSPLDD
jgi:hypothetical protein